MELAVNTWGMSYLVNIARMSYLVNIAGGQMGDYIVVK
jgi:hypothetical protein